MNRIRLQPEDNFLSPNPHISAAYFIAYDVPECFLALHSTAHVSAAVPCPSLPQEGVSSLLCFGTVPWLPCSPDCWGCSFHGHTSMEK